MGLDISYYSDIKKIDINKDDNNYDHIRINNNHNDFEYHLGSLEKDAIYKPKQKGEHGSFRAGSYGGYNNWRNQLSVIAGYDSSKEVWKNFENEFRKLKLAKIQNESSKMKPFYELINFSDCEGDIGPEISKKLYQDFIDFEEQAKKEDSYFYDKYEEWKKAFKIASKNGIVSFH